MKIQLTCDFIKPLRLKIEKVYPENNTVDVIAVLVLIGHGRLWAFLKPNEVS